MKILFYNHTGQVSGAENVLLLILSRLDRAKYESVVVCPEAGGLRQKIEDANVEVETIDDLQARFTKRPDLILRYLVSFVGTMLNFRKIVQRRQPDLIYANSTRAGLVATAATVGLRAKVVWHLHDVLPRHPLSTLIRLFAACFRRTSMIAVSGAVARAFRGKFPEKSLDVRTIHNGIEIERFAYDGAGAKKMRKELNLAENAVIFGIVGQLTPRKGQLELIHAFAKASRQLPNIRLLVVGAPIFNQDHEYQKELTFAAKICGVENKVLFLGKRTDIAAVFSLLDAAVVNSKSEPFGLVLIEAMAAGTPVLATSVDGVPELITHHETGWLVPPSDAAALEKGLLALSRLPKLRCRLGEKGHQHVCAHFSAERYIADIEKYLNEFDNSKLLLINAPLGTGQLDSINH